MPDETQVGQEPTTSKEAPAEAAAPTVTTTTRTRKSAAKKAPAKRGRR